MDMQAIIDPCGIIPQDGNGSMAGHAFTLESGRRGTSGITRRSRPAPDKPVRRLIWIKFITIVQTIYFPAHL